MLKVVVGGIYLTQKKCNGQVVAEDSQDVLL